MNDVSFVYIEYFAEKLREQNNNKRVLIGEKIIITNSPYLVQHYLITFQYD